MFIIGMTDFVALLTTLGTGYTFQHLQNLSMVISQTLFHNKMKERREREGRGGREERKRGEREGRKRERRKREREGERERREREREERREEKERREEQYF